MVGIILPTMPSILALFHFFSSNGLARALMPISDWFPF